ncbi:PLP-dependent aminotransferase family protein [Pseudomonas sp. 5P_3.1_Bac2]|uniref:aminotransferase-like domain-containing protein n=1 Tax=Pseudomonas sp. 5P_3.1_Bac2 TaxID=2971617 RepID=UPI0021CA0761|nr:PLP-dependent aminotransferase family protein [Pseudomonas sp. 5P_3.1_Bac2]MCU1719020.1 PLP-dependent aminotransferase family protein [Pseudomonas sp. 5P_3.1_Bac2]
MTHEDRKRVSANCSKDTEFAYQAVYRYLTGLIEAAPPGQQLKLPSLRQLAQRLNVSVSTTKYAYSLLEDQGLIYAKAKCGYYTQAVPATQTRASSASLLDSVFSNARQPGMLALSSDAPAMLLSLENPLLMTERELTRQYPRTYAPLYQPFGETELRSTLAERYTQSTRCYWRAEHVYVGADLRSVLEVALEALQLSGSVALVESPCSWAILRQLRAAKIRIVEIPLGPTGRFDLKQLQAVLLQEPIKLAVFSSTVNVPHGSLMPAQDKQLICRWLAERSIWLFENDSYGEFCFEPNATRYRDFADPEQLLVFSTFDKIIGSEAPYGYLLSRVKGAELDRLFLERAFRLSPIRQKAIAKLFSTRRIDQHTQLLRSLLMGRMQDMQELLHEHLADHLRVVQPQGGAAFWAEATRPVNMCRVFERLLSKHTVIAPGEIFSQQGAWQHHLRLSYTIDWSKDIAQALKLLAQAIDEECVEQSLS